MARALIAQPADREFAHALEQQLADHTHETLMISHSRGADHPWAEFLRESASFGIKIIEDFHMVRDEADGRDDHIPRARRVGLPQALADVRAEPRLRWRTAAALVDQAAICSSGPFRNQAAGFPQLRFVARMGGHR